MVNSDALRLCGPGPRAEALIGGGPMRPKRLSALLPPLIFLTALLLPAVAPAEKVL